MKLLASNYSIDQDLILSGKRIIPNISNNNGVIFDYGIVSTRIKGLIYSY